MIILKIVIAIILMLNICGSIIKAYEAGNDELSSRGIRRLVARIISAVISAIILWAGVFIEGTILVAWFRIPVLVLLTLLIIFLVWTAILYITGKMG